MNFIVHSDDITSYSFIILGFIKRNRIYFKNLKSLIALFNSIVRSKLEFFLWYGIHLIKFIKTDLKKNAQGLYAMA